VFAHLVVRMQTVTGAHIGEVQKISQNPECIKQLVNIGPKGATRWLLRLCPKGRTERCDYFIDEDTKDVLLEVLSGSLLEGGPAGQERRGPKNVNGRGTGPVG